MKNLNRKNFPDWVLSTLCNDEYASDEEMVRFFIEEGQVSEEQARTWVAERNYYGGIEYLRDSLANAEEYRAAREKERAREARRLAKLLANRG